MGAAIAVIIAVGLGAAFVLSRRGGARGIGAFRSGDSGFSAIDAVAGDDEPHHGHHDHGADNGSDAGGDSSSGDTGGGDAGGGGDGGGGGGDG